MRRTSIIGLLLLLLSLASCKEGPFYTALGDQVAKIPLRIAPAAATIVDLTSMTFSATGGTPPYTYSKVSGPGLMHRATGVFDASGGGTVRVRVTDKNKETSDATIIVTPTGLLTINPSDVTVGRNGTIQFVAVGGIFPYHFTKDLGFESGPPISDAGLYVSGFTLGDDQVRVTDSTPGTPQFAVAKVHVIATATNVNYQVQSVNHSPATVTSGRAISGYSFTLLNSGDSDGTQDVTWWVYLSDDNTTPNAPGTALIATGTASRLLKGEVSPDDILINGNWPVVSGSVTKYVFIQIAAADDLDSTNNIEGPFAVTLLPPDVNYSATEPTHTGPLVAGGAIDETFTLQNSGDDAGSQKVHWTAYVSPDSSASIDEDAIVIDSGSHDPLGAHSDSPSPISIKGTWPSAFGSYYLKLQLSAADDNDASDDIKVSTVAYHTTHVDYTIDSVSVTSPYLAGNAIGGSFQLHNTGDADGGKPVNWSAYLSSDDTLDAGDTLVASSVRAKLNQSEVAAVTITPITANWPKTIGAMYYLIVSANAADDTGSDPNVKASDPCTLDAPSVKYVVTSPVPPPAGPTLPGGIITGSFQLSNTGANNGSQLVNWSVYASPTSSATDPSARLIASGAAQPLVSGAVTPISFTCPWPLHYGKYYLVATAAALGDTDPVNIAGATDNFTAVGYIAEPTEPPSDNDDADFLTNATDLGITLQPGMSVSVTGTLSDPDDVFTFNPGSSASVSFFISWTGSQAVTLNFKKKSPVTLLAIASTLSGSGLSLSWTVDGTARWIDVHNTAGATFDYTLIITGN